jgi:type IV pilus assembly protein PilE
MSKCSGRHLGLTLIEVLVTLSIIGILAAVAYPTYLAQLRQGNRSEAQQFLLDLATREQQYLMDARSYGSLTQLNVTVPAHLSRYYAVTVVVDNAARPPTFTLTATPVSGTLQATDGTLSLTSTGVKSGPWP